MSTVSGQREKVVLHAAVDRAEGREKALEGVFVTLQNFLAVRVRVLTEARVQELKRRNLTVVAWTVDEPARATELVSWGVDGLTTNNLAAMRSIWPCH